MLKLLLSIFFISSLIAQQEVSVFGNQSTPEPKRQITAGEIGKIAPTDEPDYLRDNKEIYQQVELNELKLQTSKTPRSVYVYQTFSINLKADTEQNLNFDLNLTANLDGITWLNPKPNWNEIKKGIYETTLWFEANNTNASIDKLTLTLNRNGAFFQDASIKPKLPLIKNLKFDPNFSFVVADALDVKKIKSSKFDDLSNLITIELETKNGNLNSFAIPKEFKKQGIESIKGDYLSQNGNYFIIADTDVKEIEFSYFNLKSSKFESFKLPVKVEIDDLSTQVNLNPKESEFELYKDISIYALIAIFLLFFIFKRSYYSLVLAIAFGGYAFYDSKPFSDGMLEINSEVRILPTPNSTIFYVSKASQKVKIMSKNDTYTKIILSDKKIGWVKNENIK